MIEVYRIENIDDGKGCYNTKNASRYQFHKILLLDHTSYIEHPDLLHDTDCLDLRGMGLNKFQLFSGCTSIKQLKEWFGDHLPTILNCFYSAKTKREKPPRILTVKSLLIE